MKILKKYKNFYKIVSDVGHKNNQQQQKLDKFLKRSNLIYFKRAEQFSLKFIKYLKIEKISFKYAVDCYLKMCFDMMESQKFFLKYKKYPIKQAKTAYKKVYNNIKEMKSYVFGIALSQFLWPTHYAMYSFFIKNIEIWSCTMYDDEERILALESKIQRTFKTNYNIESYINNHGMCFLGKIIQMS